MTALFNSLKIKDITLKNRIGMAPMCQYSAVDGVMNDWHRHHLGARAMGGAALIICEATAVCPEGRISPGCVGLWNDAQMQAVAPINAFIESMCAVPAIQIGHSGRKGSANVPWDGGAHIADADPQGWPTYSPTAEAFDPDGTRLWKTPKEMSLYDIATMKNHFVATAKRALECGYKILELHAAHGYLQHSFLTPLINTRTDAYGGDLRSRARFLLETAEAVRAVWPEHLPLAARISIHDWIDGGHGLDENIQIAKWLKEAGVDMVDCSGGGATPKARGSIGERTSSQVDLAGELRAATGLTTMAVGYITDPKQANSLIESGTCDITLLGRQLLRDPYWPTRAAQELGVDPKPHMPVQYHVVAS